MTDMTPIDNGLSWQYFPPNTSFRLCNVHWDMSYRDIVKFADKDAQQNYFDGLPSTVVQNTSGYKYGSPIRLPIPFNQANQYNYVIVYNDYPGIESPRYWYYFIQNVQMINLNVTQFTVMLDVVQSYQFDVTLGNCYVERGHIGIANDKANDDNGRTYLDIPEGLDTGAESVVVDQAYNNFIDKNNAGIIVLSSISLIWDPGTVSDPKLNIAQGSLNDGIPNGLETYYFKSPDDFMSMMQHGQQYSWAMQGIQRVYMVPALDTSKMSPGWLFNNSALGVPIYYVNYASMVNDQDVSTEVNFRDTFQLPQRYHNLTKFRTYPYAWIEVTLMNGNSLIIKPQDVYQNNLTVHRVAQYGAPTPRAAYYVRSLHGGDGGRQDVMTDELGEMMNATIGVIDYPSFSIVNNSGQLYLASNAHSIAYEFKNAEWAQQKTMMGVNNAYAQSQLGAGYNTARTAAGNANRSSMTNISNQSTATATAIAQNQANFEFGMQQLNTIGSAAATAVGDAATGNPGGAVGAVVGGAIGAYANNATYNQSNQTRAATLANSINTANAGTAQSNSYANSVNNLNNEQTMTLADMNRNLGSAVASGDYSNAIAGINAKIQDTHLMSPAVQGNMSGDVLLYATNRYRMWRRWRQIMPAAMHNIGEYWLRYGYYVQRFLMPPSNWQVMQHFTFWKMHELYIRSSTCPEEFRLTMKAIFEKGVTVWNNPDEIGVHDYGDNEPLPGIEY